MRLHAVRRPRTRLVRGRGNTPVGLLSILPCRPAYGQSKSIPPWLNDTFPRAAQRDTRATTLGGSFDTRAVRTLACPFGNLRTRDSLKRRLPIRGTALA